MCDANNLYMLANDGNGNLTLAHTYALPDGGGPIAAPGPERRQ